MSTHDGMILTVEDSGFFNKPCSEVKTKHSSVFVSQKHMVKLHIREETGDRKPSVILDKTP